MRKYLILVLLPLFGIACSSHKKNYENSINDFIMKNDERAIVSDAIDQLKENKKSDIIYFLNNGLDICIRYDRANLKLIYYKALLLHSIKHYSESEKLIVESENLIRDEKWLMQFAFVNELNGNILEYNRKIVSAKNIMEGKLSAKNVVADSTLLLNYIAAKMITDGRDSLMKQVENINKIVGGRAESTILQAIQNLSSHNY